MRQLQPAGGDVDLVAAYDQPGSSLRVNFVSSADGAATVEGRSDGLSGPADKIVFRLLRSLADVVMVGAGTARTEGYAPVRLSADQQQWRKAHGRSPIPPLAVVSRSLKLDPAGRMFADADVRPLVLTGLDAPEQALAALAPVADVITGATAAQWLAQLAERGLTRVLCEGGPGLLGSLLADNLVDELCLTLAPLLARQRSAPIADHRVDGKPLRLDLAHVLSEDGFLFLRYAIDRD